MPWAEHLALYGCKAPLPARTALRAGGLSLERSGGRFGPILAHGHEVWHGVAFLFRDAGWGTPEPVFDQEDLRQTAQGFVLNLRGHIACAPSDVAGAPAADAHIDLHLTVQGHADGRLQWHARAEPSHDLRTNRCGWVLMHPLSVAGHALHVRHVDGRSSVSSWPEEVPAWPPFTGVRSLRHEYAPGHWAEACLPGEDYEVEDQRNNADASFKTYSRSNFMPRPWVWHRGQAMERELHLRLETEAPAAHTAPAACAAPQLPPQPWTPAQPPMRLGMALSQTMTDGAAPWMLEVLRDLRPGFLHLTLWTEQDMRSLDWQAVRTLQQAAGASLRLDLCGLEALGCAGAHDALCRLLAQRIASAGVVVSAVAALPCGPQGANLLKALFPGALVGGGTAHFFAQLNRLEGSGGEDFMAFTVCPTVHGTDDAEVMHSLQSLPSMLATAHRRHPGRAWHLGPSGLSARASPLGPQPASDGLQRRALARRDPRSQGLFGAAWLLGHLAGAARAGVQALTTPPLIGDDGLWTPAGDTGRATPAAALLGVCLRWPTLQAVHAPDPDGHAPAWAALTGQGPQGRQMLLANLGPQALAWQWSQGGNIFVLDADAWVQHQAAPQGSPWRAAGTGTTERQLGPYALVRIDLPPLTGN